MFRRRNLEIGYELKDFERFQYRQTSAKVHCRVELVELVGVVEFVEFAADAVVRREKAMHDSKIA
jgi:hypothetical protein